MNSRLASLGVAIVFVGFLVVAVGASAGPGGSSFSGGFVLVGPIPIVFGSGPNSGTLATVGLVITVAMVAVYLLFFILWKSGSRREVGVGFCSVDSVDKDPFQRGWWHDNPKNNIRNLKAQATKSTIAMAFKSKGAVIIAADSQGTVGDGTTRYLTKIFPIGENALVGLSGVDVSWNADLVQRIRSAKGNDPVSKVKKGMDLYDSEIYNKFGNRYPDPRFYSGVLGVFDKEPRIFEFQSMGTVREEVDRGFLLTGEARRSADPLVRIANLAMIHAWGGNPNATDQERTWLRFSPKLVAQFAVITLSSLPAIESSVSPNLNLHHIDKDGHREVGMIELFPHWPDRVWSDVAEQLYREVTAADIAAFDSIFHLLPEPIAAYFKEWAKGNPSWKLSR